MQLERYVKKCKYYKLVFYKYKHNRDNLFHYKLA